jgi:hypothetical protein
VASYYYAGGQKIELVPDPDCVAVDISRVRSRSAALHDVLAAGEPLLGNVRLVRRDALSPSKQAQLERQCALLPVFRHGYTLIVVLPEVRVELQRGQDSKLDSFVRSGRIRATVERDPEGRVVLRPVSGKGVDALAIANKLHETLAPPLAQAHFLRRVRKR